MRQRNKIVHENKTWWRKWVQELWWCTYSQSWISIWMEDGKSTHCTNKNTHRVSIMWHCLYDILRNMIKGVQENCPVTGAVSTLWISMVWVDKMRNKIKILIGQDSTFHITILCITRTEKNNCHRHFLVNHLLENEYNHTKSPCGTAECCATANSHSDNWPLVGRFPYTDIRIKGTNQSCTRAWGNWVQNICYNWNIENCMFSFYSN